MGTRERITFTSLPFLRGIEAVSGEDVTNVFGKHIHATCIVGRVQKGVRMISHDGDEVRIPCGDLFVVNPGLVHACTSGEGGAHSYALLSIASSVLARVASQISERAEPGVWFEGVHRTHGMISRRLGDFFEMLSDPLSPSFEKESHLYTLLAEIVLAFAQAPPEVCRVGRQQGAMARVRSYIQAHHDAPISLASLSDVACLSPFHLQRLFTFHYGISPHRYVTHYRIAEARKLLVKGAAIGDAALATGFSDQSHLTRHFKRVVGTTPGRFIQANRS
ncbi:AraC family transcriptional regulator [Desulfoluna sp.]|uniref:helix-turn-helix transcriptional regulator n=1 Tax=Desulfoluna sp. TaxID=2045199 RepID=UPI002602424F|nr:AraC family transcriptional regulator [Desulfoluna sp.]